MPFTSSLSGLRSLQHRLYSFFAKFYHFRKVRGGGGGCFILPVLSTLQRPWPCALHCIVCSRSHNPVGSNRSRGKLKRPLSVCLSSSASNPYVSTAWTPCNIFPLGISLKWSFLSRNYRRPGLEYSSFERNSGAAAVPSARHNCLVHMTSTMCGIVRSPHPSPQQRPCMLAVHRPPNA